MPGMSDNQQKIVAFTYTKNYDALVCNGAVRSGKTSIMTVAFIDWAMRTFKDRNFAICSHTVGSCIRNVMKPYLDLSYVKKRYAISVVGAPPVMMITRGSVKNTFYIFGGHDESSYKMIQGITLAGVMLDEAPLMPRSFVDQATSRCSVEGARFFFNCNPAGSVEHWFYKEWIEGAKSKKAYVINFTLDDNPSLSEAVKDRYKRMYTGIFYERYILGLWVMAEGLIYPDFAEAAEEPFSAPCVEYAISMDYGTQNATAMILWGRSGNAWHALNEYYYSGRDTGRPLTDDEYYTALDALAGGTPCRQVIVDPSAASFITLCRRKGRFSVKKADNDVMDGIRDTAVAMRRGYIRIGKNCVNTLKELGMYCWDSKSADDRPVKENDHACDAIRYFVKTKKLVKGERKSLI